jgi:hypothetical protein
MALSCYGPQPKPDAYELSTASYKLIYVYSDTIPEHSGRLKVGETTLKTAKKLKDITEADLLPAARARINSYTNPGDVPYTIEHVELAVRTLPTEDESSHTPRGYTSFEGFRDYNVHAVLLSSGFEKKFARADKHTGEWFEATVDDVRLAIRAVKEHRSSIAGFAALPARVVLRDEQRRAVAETLTVLKGGTYKAPRFMLWNAKMRFGKTLTAYALIRELSKRRGDEVKKVLVMTHRPVVLLSGWLEDLKKSGLEAEGWDYGSRDSALSFEQLQRKEKFIYFASVQDLRGSYTGDNISEADFSTLTKNSEVFSTQFDLTIVDEVHEGLTSPLAQKMSAAIQSRYYLDLSGTPFNILAIPTWEDEALQKRFIYHGQYNWSYLDERKAKLWWELNRPHDPNPHGASPEACFVTYDVSNSLKQLADSASEALGVSVDLGELFRTERPTPTDPPRFVHEDDVFAVLAKLRGDKRYSHDPTLFPFHDSREDYFPHTLWMLPSVDACIAMAELLGRPSSGFAGYGVVNATGANYQPKDPSAPRFKGALEAVEHMIRQRERTITLSQQMLTTGVSVPEWTGILMLSNISSPMLYMQAAFRVTTAGSLPDGRVKEAGYIFDIHPNRVLKQISELARHSAVPAIPADSLQQYENDAESIAEHFEYISVLTEMGSTFVEPPADKAAIMERLQEVYIDEVVATGFSSPRLWSTVELNNLDVKRAEVMNRLRLMQGGAVRTGTVEVSKFSDEDRQRLRDLEKRRKRDSPGPPLSDAEKVEVKKLQEAKKQERKNRDSVVAILAGIAARMPLLVFASPADRRITPSNFADGIDDASWQEFMPKQLLRKLPKDAPPLEERLEDPAALLYWDDIRQCFDPAIFAGACERIRFMIETANSYSPLKRAAWIAHMFSSYRNPDRETVLTPWRVVNHQYISTLGGLRWVTLDGLWRVRKLDVQEGEEAIHWVTEELLFGSDAFEPAPEWVDPPEKVENIWEDPDLSTFDINSKTALYPLFAAASRYYLVTCHLSGSESEHARATSRWARIVEKHIFLNVRVKWSERIAQQVLLGNLQQAVNCSVVDVLELRKAVTNIAARFAHKYYREVRQEKVSGGDARKRFAEEFEEAIYSWVFNPTSVDAGEKRSPFGRMVETIRPMAEERAQRIMNVATVDTTLEEFAKLLEEAVSTSADGFIAVVGNPPYQMEVSSSGKALPIWPIFLSIAASIADKVSSINPARWLNSSGFDEVHLLCFSERRISRLVRLPLDTFQGVGITGGVVIELLDSIERDSWVEVDLQGNQVQRDFTFKLSSEPVLSLKDESIVAKIASKKLPSVARSYFISGQDNKTVTKTSQPIGDPRMDHAIVTQRLKRDPDYFLSSRPHDLDSYVEIYNLSKQKIETKFLPLSEFAETVRNKERLAKWKVFFMRSDPKALYRKNIFIAPPKSIATNAWMGRLFDSEEEAKNYKSYLASFLYRYLLNLKSTGISVVANSHSLVPDLAKCKNLRTGLVGWESDWNDEDLKQLFKEVLTDDDWEYIERVAIESDPSSQGASKVV